MDFTREPIIETVLTPKEGFKLVVRSSKGGSQEEHFVDSVEIVSFGNSQFFRSLERPKSFLVPVSDYEVLEVREARMVLKNVGLDRSIKIGGGREAVMRTGREVEKSEPEYATAYAEELPGDHQEEASAPTTAESRPAADGKGDKKRDRRTRYRRRRGGREETKEEGTVSEEEKSTEEKTDVSSSQKDVTKPVSETPNPIPSFTSALLPPPATLISETIARYKDNALFKGAFYVKNEELPNDEQSSEQESEEVEGTQNEGHRRSFPDDSQYPSLDVIDEQIDRPTLPETQVVLGEELWNFVEEKPLEAKVEEAKEEVKVEEDEKAEDTSST